MGRGMRLIAAFSTLSLVISSAGAVWYLSECFDRVCLYWDGNTVNTNFANPHNIPATWCDDNGCVDVPCGPEHCTGWSSTCATHFGHELLPTLLNTVLGSLISVSAYCVKVTSSGASTVSNSLCDNTYNWGSKTLRECLMKFPSSQSTTTSCTPVEWSSNTQFCLKSLAPPCRTGALTGLGALVTRLVNGIPPTVYNMPNWCVNPGAGKTLVSQPAPSNALCLNSYTASGFPPSAVYRKSVCVYSGNVVDDRYCSRAENSQWWGDSMTRPCTIEDAQPFWRYGRSCAEYWASGAAANVKCSIAGASEQIFEVASSYCTPFTPFDPSGCATLSLGPRSCSNVQYSNPGCYVGSSNQEFIGQFPCQAQFDLQKYDQSGSGCYTNGESLAVRVKFHTCKAIVDPLSGSVTITGSVVLMCVYKVPGQPDAERDDEFCSALNPVWTQNFATPGAWVQECNASLISDFQWSNQCHEIYREAPYPLTAESVCVFDNGTDRVVVADSYCTHLTRPTGKTLDECSELHPAFTEESCYEPIEVVEEETVCSIKGAADRVIPTYTATCMSERNAIVSPTYEQPDTCYPPDSDAKLEVTDWILTACQDAFSIPNGSGQTEPEFDPTTAIAVRECRFTDANGFTRTLDPNFCVCEKNSKYCGQPTIQAFERPCTIQDLPRRISTQCQYVYHDGSLTNPKPRCLAKGAQDIEYIVDWENCLEFLQPGETQETIAIPPPSQCSILIPGTPTTTCTQATNEYNGNACQVSGTTATYFEDLSPCNDAIAALPINYHQPAQCEENATHFTPWDTSACASSFTIPDGDDHPQFVTGAGSQGKAVRQCMYQTQVIAPEFCDCAKNPDHCPEPDPDFGAALERPCSVLDLDRRISTECHHVYYDGNPSGSPRCVARGANGTDYVVDSSYCHLLSAPLPDSFPSADDCSELKIGTPTSTCTQPSNIYSNNKCYVINTNRTVEFISLSPCAEAIASLPISYAQPTDCVANATQFGGWNTSACAAAFEWDAESSQPKFKEPSEARRHCLYMGDEGDPIEVPQQYCDCDHNPIHCPQPPDPYGASVTRSCLISDLPLQLSNECHHVYYDGKLNGSIRCVAEGSEGRKYVVDPSYCDSITPSIPLEVPHPSECSVLLVGNPTSTCTQASNVYENNICKVKGPTPIEVVFENLSPCNEAIAALPPAYGQPDNCVANATQFTDWDVSTCQAAFGLREGSSRPGFDPETGIARRKCVYFASGPTEPPVEVPDQYCDCELNPTHCPTPDSFGSNTSRPCTLTDLPLSVSTACRHVYYDGRVSNPQPQCVALGAGDAEYIIDWSQCGSNASVSVPQVSECAVLEPGDPKTTCTEPSNVYEGNRCRVLGTTTYFLDLSPCDELIAQLPTAFIQPDSCFGGPERLELIRNTSACSASFNGTSFNGAQAVYRCVYTNETGSFQVAEGFCTSPNPHYKGPDVANWSEPCQVSDLVRVWSIDCAYTIDTDGMPRCIGQGQNSLWFPLSDTDCQDIPSVDPVEPGQCPMWEVLSLGCTSIDRRIPGTTKHMLRCVVIIQGQKVAVDDANCASLTPPVSQSEFCYGSDDAEFRWVATPFDQPHCGSTTEVNITRGVTCEARPHGSENASFVEISPEHYGRCAERAGPMPTTNAVITVPLCAEVEKLLAYEYSEWSECLNNMQSRTVACMDGDVAVDIAICVDQIGAPNIVQKYCHPPEMAALYGTAYQWRYKLASECPHDPMLVCSGDYGIEISDVECVDTFPIRMARNPLDPYTVRIPFRDPELMNLTAVDSSLCMAPPVAQVSDVYLCPAPAELCALPSPMLDGVLTEYVDSHDPSDERNFQGALTRTRTCHNTSSEECPNVPLKRPATAKTLDVPAIATSFRGRSFSGTCRTDGYLRRNPSVENVTTVGDLQFCGIPTVYQYRTTQWSTCSKRCGLGGIQTREVTCILNEVSPRGLMIALETQNLTLCSEHLGPPPTSLRACNEGVTCANPYEWEYSEWSAVAFECTPDTGGVVQQVRQRSCRSTTDGTVVDDSLCSRMPSQSLTRMIQIPFCGAVEWTEGYFGQCSDVPGVEEPVSTRKVRCIAGDKILPDHVCEIHAGAKPLEVRGCGCDHGAWDAEHGRCICSTGFTGARCDSDSRIGQVVFDEIATIEGGQVVMSWTNLGWIDVPVAIDLMKHTSDGSNITQTVARLTSVEPGVSSALITLPEAEAPAGQYYFFRLSTFAGTYTETDPFAVVNGFSRVNCSEPGTRSVDYMHAFCECRPNWQGKHCTNNPCLEHCPHDASCDSADLERTCTCQDGQHFSNHSRGCTDICSELECEHGGHPDQGCKTCVCSGSWYGASCQKCGLRNACGIGLPSVDCGRCVCPRGTIGQFCECRALTVRLALKRSIVLSPNERETMRADLARAFGLQPEQVHVSRGQPITSEASAGDTVQARIAVEISFKPSQCTHAPQPQPNPDPQHGLPPRGPGTSIQPFQPQQHKESKRRRRLTLSQIQSHSDNEINGPSSLEEMMVFLLSKFEDPAQLPPAFHDYDPLDGLTIMDTFCVENSTCVPIVSIGNGGPPLVSEELDEATLSSDPADDGNCIGQIGLDSDEEQEPVESDWVLPMFIVLAAASATVLVLSFCSCRPSPAGTTIDAPDDSRAAGGA